MHPSHRSASSAAAVRVCLCAMRSSSPEMRASGTEGPGARQPRGPIKKRGQESQAKGKEMHRVRLRRHAWMDDAWQSRTSRLRRASSLSSVWNRGPRSLDVRSLISMTADPAWPWRACFGAPTLGLRSRQRPRSEARSGSRWAATPLCTPPESATCNVDNAVAFARSSHADHKKKAFAERRRKSQRPCSSCSRRVWCCSGAMQCARGQALRQLNYPRASKAYEKDDIPAHVSASQLPQ